MRPRSKTDEYSSAIGGLFTVLVARKQKRFQKAVSEVSFGNVRIIRTSRLSTVGDRRFAVAAARVWNEPHRHITAASTLPEFSAVVS